MKILFAIIFQILPFYCTSQVFRSEDFEKQGLKEYISYNLGKGKDLEIYCVYWTNKSDKHQDLKILEDRGEVKIQFPNSRGIYNLEDRGNELHCIHPNGLRQVFYLLPEVYSSENYERKGIVEYIQTNQWLYFTSENIHKKVPLQVGWNSEDNEPLFFSFPKDKKRYKYYKPASCERAFVLEHSDGKRQKFSYDPWYFE